MPGKNIKLLAGKPLITWTIEAAKSTSQISKVIVNTDDEEIAKIARNSGAEVFNRPKDLAQDLTEDLPVFIHHLNALKEEGNLPDMIVDLRATAPLRRKERIAEGIEILKKLGREKADSVRAVSKAAKHPFKMWRHQDNFLLPFVSEEHSGVKEPYNAPRQVLPKIYQNNGSMNAFWPETILEKNSMTGERIAGYVMEDWESINIDSEIDFLIAEKLMEQYKDFFN